MWHGPEGLTRIARRVNLRAATLKVCRERAGFTVPTAAFFDTITVATGAATAGILARGVAAGVNFRRVQRDAVIGLSVDETTTQADLERVVRAFTGSDSPARIAELEAEAPSALPPGLARTSPFLTHPTFNRYHCETEMLRYLRRLADRDIALDRAMIPLGSCTMKLNATAEMIPVTWPSSARSIRSRLRTRRKATPSCSPTSSECSARSPAMPRCRCNRTPARKANTRFLPSAGTTRAAARAIARVCLIPASAHGTNPASAQMAGMQVVVVACDGDGNVDLADLEAKARAHARELAAIMVTYPSTHGVFEEGIRRICEIVHAQGGQVYVDGANLNALVGLARPGRFRAPTSRTSTCTRRSAFRTAAAAPASARSASARTSRRSSPAIAIPRRATRRAPWPRHRTAARASCRSRGCTSR